MPTGDLKAGNDNDMGEGCVTVTWIQFNLQLLQITGETKYSEELERSVYNHLLAAENPETGCVSYYTALQGPKPYRCDQGYSCCLSSVPRGISLIPEMLGGKINNVFTVLMYENGQATDNIVADDQSNVTLNIKSTTKFPVGGKVDFVVTPSESKTFKINFRVPQWSENFTAKVGTDVYTGKKGETLGIDRKWSAGDHISITFDMPVQIIPGGKSYPNDVAIKRGPQVLAIDHGLNPQVGSLAKVVFDKNNDLLTGADVKTNGWDWKEAFYVDMKVNGKKEKVVMVPFSEAGQTTADIEVWICHSGE
jgi:DUF1680 family protein